MTGASSSVACRRVAYGEKSPARSRAISSPTSTWELFMLCSKDAALSAPSSTSRSSASAIERHEPAEVLGRRQTVRSGVLKLVHRGDHVLWWRQRGGSFS